ncbi:MocR-like pyridoxine biosynthesis transcription factor PdxR [Ureibacillus sinduriensis]|uniref:GntR family transcriptional regulator n=1 Tax=Ureibacillus sinduriensis BLB-1 = JCM 15800 TaxID=1384057 RepID=A0A0A3HSR7_9BACL|nr:PLP-dependent aminotransferase family protein [Ureibacillus sinduriensis]KGR74255.1 GntR family transcriptional regulator [Ureibacillus sinduriensis BLB-1 = JCM 15800]
MDIPIIFSNKQPKYLDIYEQIKQRIINQTLAAHQKLPSKRRLATNLSVSIHTIKESYEQLASEGYIYSVERSGYYISPYDSEWEQPIYEEEKKREQPVQEILYNFKNGQVDQQAFPLKDWLKLYKKHLNSDIVPNGSWQGEWSLREQIALYIKKSKGFTCDVEQIYLYSGTQHQLNELCRYFGDVNVAIEEPGFRRASAIFQQNQLNIQYVPIDEKGAAIPENACQYYYITPAHQFPLGGVMPFERRIDLLKWATENDAFLIEDDYDSEFRYKGSPIPPLAQIDQLQRVIYFGTFSKTLMPSIRVSYMILPTSLVDGFNSFYSNHKTTVSKIDQSVIAEFMENGLYTKHIAKMRTLYRKKRQKLIESILSHLGEDYEIIGDDAGLHIVLRLPKSLNEWNAIKLAQDVGIALDPISSSYQLNPVDNCVMIGYGAIPYAVIEEAVSLLASQWKSKQ